MNTTSAGKLPKEVPWALDRVEDGDSVIVTRGKKDGEPKPVAAIVPYVNYMHYMAVIVGAAEEAPQQLPADHPLRRDPCGP